MFTFYLLYKTKITTVILEVCTIQIIDTENLIASFFPPTYHPLIKRIFQVYRNQFVFPSRNRYKEPQNHTQKEKFSTLTTIKNSFRMP